MKFSLRMRKWHRWLALIVGVQVLLWTVSGLFMSFVPIETVRSENLIKTPDFIPLKIGADFTSAAEAIESSGMSPDSIKEIKLKILVTSKITNGSLYLLVYDGELSGAAFRPFDYVFQAFGQGRRLPGRPIGKKKPGRSSWAGSRDDGDSYARPCNVSSQ